MAERKYNFIIVISIFIMKWKEIFILVLKRSVQYVGRSNQ